MQDGGEHGDAPKQQEVKQEAQQQQQKEERVRQEAAAAKLAQGRESDKGQSQGSDKGKGDKDRSKEKDKSGSNERDKDRSSEKDKDRGDLAQIQGKTGDKGDKAGLQSGANASDSRSTTGNLFMPPGVDKIYNDSMKIVKTLMNMTPAQLEALGKQIFSDNANAGDRQNQRPEKVTSKLENPEGIGQPAKFNDRINPLDVKFDHPPERFRQEDRERAMEIQEQGKLLLSNPDRDGYQFIYEQNNNFRYDTTRDNSIVLEYTPVGRPPEGKNETLEQLTDIARDGVRDAVIDGALEGTKQATKDALGNAITIYEYADFLNRVYKDGHKENYFGISSDAQQFQHDRKVYAAGHLFAVANPHRAHESTLSNPDGNPVIFADNIIRCYRQLEKLDSEYIGLLQRNSTPRSYPTIDRAP